MIAERLEEAGFVDFELAAVDFTVGYTSLDDWWASTHDLSMRFADATRGMDERHQGRDPGRARRGGGAVHGRGRRDRHPRPHLDGRRHRLARWLISWTAQALPSGSEK